MRAASQQHPAAAPGSSRDRENRLADADRRSMAAAGRYRQDPEVMEQVDAVLEMAPPSSATYVLRLLAHATDPEQVRTVFRICANCMPYSDACPVPMPTLPPPSFPPCHVPDR